MAEAENRRQGSYWVWRLTLLCAAAGALLGLWFGPSIGESAAVGAVALGLMGAVPGLIIGLIVAWTRRTKPVRPLPVTERERFVDSLNRRASSQNQFSIDPDDPRALVMTYTRKTDGALTSDFKQKLARSVERVVSAQMGKAAEELRPHGFNKWIFKVNGETILERPIP